MAMKTSNCEECNSTFIPNESKKFCDYCYHRLSIGLEEAKKQTISEMRDRRLK